MDPVEKAFDLIKRYALLAYLSNSERRQRASRKDDDEGNQGSRKGRGYRSWI